MPKSIFFYLLNAQAFCLVSEDFDDEICITYLATDGNLFKEAQKC